MMTGIPDSVIEAMLRAYTDGMVRGAEPPVSFMAMRAALRAAEAKGYKLIARDPVPEFKDWFAYLDDYQAWWDAAPGVGKS